MDSKADKARTGPSSVARFKPEVHPRSELTKCPEQEEQLKSLLGPPAVGFFKACNVVNIF